MNKAFIIVLFALGLAGCAGDSAYREGERLLAQGQTEAGLQQLEQAVRENPGSVQYRTAYIQARDVQIARLFAQADAALLEGRYDEAAGLYRSILALHPQSVRAQSSLASIETRNQDLALMKQARSDLQKGEIEAARSKLRTVLAREPGQAEAQTLMKQVEEKSGKSRGAEFPKLAATFRRPVTMQFRDAAVRTIFDALSRQSGLNFVFDKDVRTDARLTIFAVDTPISDILDMLLKTGQMAKKVLNDNTLLIYPATPVKLKEYQDLVVKSFFLGNTEAKQMVNLVRSMTKTRDVYIDEKLNLMIVRDTPEAVRLVEKLVAVADRPEPEVMLEVEIMEVKRTRLQELGVQWPSKFTVLTPGLGDSLTLDTLQNITSADIGVSPNPVLNLRKVSGDANLLANPRIRVKNKEKARVHIGDKLPVITSNVASTGVISESVSYIDVGLKVDVEPQVFLDGEVGMKVGLEVSNVVNQVKTDNGTLVYQLGSRNATTVLRLKDGETGVLAGLISDEDRSGASKVPGLGDLPLIGRLFSNNLDDLTKTEIVLMITPRIIRNIDRPDLEDGEFFGGTESVASDQALQLRSSTGIPGLPPVPSRPGQRGGGDENTGPVELAPEPDPDPGLGGLEAPQPPGAAPAQ
jgi:general secretion pathway protein D